MILLALQQYRWPGYEAVVQVFALTGCFLGRTDGTEAWLEQRELQDVFGQRMVPRVSLLSWR